ncbi:hypothetical protein B0H13DRAFT_1971155 [Mycena leptocephala]|nr:hypothetical protein B0H13DRAFT_1971155 [Mycena leptocephala]
MDSPAHRREISLIIFSLTVFALSYNIDSSIRLVGLHRLSQLGLGGRRTAIGPDGRRVSAARDSLEKMIYGDWAWDPEHIAGTTGTESGEGVGRHGRLEPMTSRTLGETTVDQAFWRWGDALPHTELKKHVLVCLSDFPRRIFITGLLVTSGYTVVDNIILFNGTMNIVTDEPEWKILSPQQARDQLGPFGGGIIRGVTWMGADSTPHNSTLLALWRTYSSLDPEIGSEGTTTLAPPRRLLYPYYGFFTDINPEHADVTTRRQRVVNGIHPELVKAAFPFLTVMYYADWEDYHMMEVPFVIERLVVADHTAAKYGVQEHDPIYASPFKMEGTSEHWWEPIRRSIATYFEVYGENAPTKAVTYVHRQSQSHGLRLSDEDHLALVGALQKMERDYEMSWSERLRAITRSSVMLGVYDSDLLDSVYMQRMPHTTLMEFSRRRRSTRAGDGCKVRQLSGDDLPSVSRSDEAQTQAVPIDVSAIIGAIRQALQ